MPPPRPPLAIHTWPRRAARHPWRVLGATVAAIAALVFVFSMWGGKYEDAFSIKGTQAQSAVDLLKARFPQAAGDSTTFVVKAPAGLNDAAVHARVDTLIT